MLNNILNLDGVTVLDKKQQSTINGGDNFTCHCGFVGGPYEQLTFAVEAGSVNDALWGAGHACGGLGATCSGD
ncbi:hypothetical protein [Winogradskyella wichelsiae]|uniref:hypothetical protein n=1 Tax=Winogradskyella wichelsiae TaxID=2697007 RepID=UPI003EF42A65